MGAIPKKKYSVEEYLQMELTAPYKSEYYKGEIFPMGEIEGDTPEAMAGALPAHNLIGTNITIELGSKLRGKGCRIFGSDQRIFIPEAGLYTYPDISVFCGPLEYETFMTLKNPILLVEILSKVTEDYNRGTKFKMYRSIPTLQEYLMVDSQQVLVELWRKENGRWTLVTETTDVNNTIELRSINATFLLKDFYLDALELIEQQKHMEQ